MQNTRNSGGLIIATLAMIGSVFLGLTAIVLPYWFVIAMLGLLLAALLAWRWPEYAIVFILLLSSGIVPPQFAPNLRLMGGNIKGEDIVLLLLLCTTVFRLLVKPTGWQGLRAYFWPLGLFALLGFISLVYALFYAHTPAKSVLAEAEPLLYWTMLPLVALVADNEKKVRRLAMALAGLGLLLAAALSVQSLTGYTLIYGGRIEIAETLGKYYSDVTRSTAPGIFLVIFGIVFFVGRHLMDVDRPIVSFVAIATLALGLMFTFGRTLWASAVLGLVLLAMLVGMRAVLKLVLFGTVSLTIILSALGLAKPDMFTAVADRVMSVEAEVEQGSSMAWRYLENGYALRAIERSPLIGVGFGGDYKPVLKVGDPEQTRVIHNGYLYLFLKLGLPAIIPLIWLYVVFVGQALVVRNKHGDPRLKVIVISVLSVSLLPLASSMARPEWMSPQTIGCIAALMGLVVAIGRLPGRPS